MPVLYVTFNSDKLNQHAFLSLYPSDCDGYNISDEFNSVV